MIELKNWKLIGLLWVVIIAIYFPSFQYPLIDFDDNLYIYNNPNVLNFGWDKLKPIFFNYSFGHYFPLTIISYGLQNLLFGLDGGYFHGFNVLLHCINATLVFFLFLRFEFSALKSFLVAIIFAVNPIQVESVAWVGTRGGILSAFFILLGLISYLTYLNTKNLKSLLVVYALFVLAILSKSSAIIFPILLFLFDFIKARKISWGLIIEKIPALTVSFFFAIIALIAAKELGTIEKGLAEVDWFNQIWVIGYAISFYFLKPIWPLGLSNMHYDSFTLYQTIPLYYKVSALIFLITLGAMFFVAKSKKLFLFSLGWYFINLMLVINILPIGGTVASERYAYLTILSLPLFAFSLPQIKWPKKLNYVFLGVGVVVLSILSHQRLKVWSSSKSLFEDLINKYPDFSYGYYGLANFYLEQKEYKKAIGLYNEGIKIDPKKEYFLNRGVAYYRQGKPDSALIDLNIHARVAPNEPGTYTNRGLVKYALGDLEGALNDYNLAIELDSTNQKAYFNRAQLRFELFDEAGACEDLRKAQKKGFENAKIYYDKFCGLHQKIASGGAISQTGEKISYPNGKVKFEVINQTIENDSGLWLVHYDSTGNKLEEGMIKRGKYFGQVRWYHPNGKLKIKGYYKNILPVGDWEEFYDTGEKLASYKFSKGLKEGEEFYFFKNGITWTKRIYENGKIFNVIEINNAGGSPLEIGTFSNGNGNLNIYNEKGNLTAVLSYKNGVRIK